MIKYNGDKQGQLKLFKKLIDDFSANQFDVVNIKITPDALNYIIANVKPVCSLDFVGYLFPIYTKKSFQINGILDLFGNIRLYSGTEGQPLSEKLAKKVIKKLLKISFIELTIDPFPEFDSYYTVPIDPENTLFIDKPIFKNYLTEEQLDKMRDLYEYLEVE